jgi:hypothetical protein
MLPQPRSFTAYQSWVFWIWEVHRGAETAIVIPGVGFCRCATCQPARAAARRHETEMRRIYTERWREKLAGNLLAKRQRISQLERASSSAETTLPHRKVG